MADSKLFDIVGHFDLIKVFKYMPNGDINQMAKPALEAIKKADMVLELNVAGYRKPIGEAYPSPSLLKQAYELGIPITFASDAHKPEQIAMFNDKIIKLAREVGYTQCAYFSKCKRIMREF